jgi:hypothetical protein
LFHFVFLRTAHHRDHIKRNHISATFDQLTKSRHEVLD